MKVWELLEILNEKADLDTVFFETADKEMVEVDRVESGRHPLGTARVVVLKEAK